MRWTEAQLEEYQAMRAYKSRWKETEKMPRPKVAKSRRPEAEKAAEHYLHEVCGCDPAQIRKAVRTKWQSVDFWGSDVMGRTQNGYVYFAQVTAGQIEAVRQRRRKLEKISWNAYETVLLLQMVETPNPANARRKDFYFRVHRYFHQDFEWSVDDEAYKIPREWFQKLKR